MGWSCPLFLTSSLAVLSLSQDLDQVVRAPGTHPCKTVKWNTCQFPFQWETPPLLSWSRVDFLHQVPGTNILRVHQVPIDQWSCLVQNHGWNLRGLPVNLPGTKPGYVQVVNLEQLKPYLSKIIVCYLLLCLVSLWKDNIGIRTVI